MFMLKYIDFHSRGLNLSFSQVGVHACPTLFQTLYPVGKRLAKCSFDCMKLLVLVIRV